MASAEITVDVRVVAGAYVVERRIVQDHCDVETGDLMLPIRNGLFEGRGSVNVLRWRPGKTMTCALDTQIPGYERMMFRVGRYDGGWCYYQIDPPCCPFGRDEYENMACTLALGYLPNWHKES